MDAKPLIYVWLGPKLPGYARKSLRLAARRTGLSIILLGDGRRPKRLLKEVHWVDISGFYSRSEFEAFAADSPQDPGFRAGFWFKVSERFFVLDQFQKWSGINEFFHAELDVLIFDISTLSSKLDSIGRGLFVPQDRSDRMIASLVYINSPEILGDFCSFLIDNPASGIEMYILRDFLEMNPQRVFSLPSGTSLILKDHTSWDTVDVHQVGGVVDATDFGRYIFGLDFRNTSQKVYNHYLDELQGKDSIDADYTPPTFSHKLFLSRDGRKLSAQVTNGRINVYAMHVHSKVFGKLSKPFYLRKLIDRHNRGKPTLINRNSRRRVVSQLRKVQFFRKVKQLIFK